MRPRIAVALMAALLSAGLAPPVARAQGTGDQVTAADIQEIAREAYVYGFPMVDNLRIQHSYCIDKTSPEYKAPYFDFCSLWANFSGCFRTSKRF
ncbi:MAG: hypothetical protein ACKOEX_07770 [Planctomycetia bacterium]